MPEPALIYIKPARPGEIVRDPVTMIPLAPEGELKPFTLHWRRQLAVGDVIRSTPPAEAYAAPVKSKNGGAE